MDDRTPSAVARGEYSSLNSFTRVQGEHSGISDKSGGEVSKPGNVSTKVESMDP